MNDCEKGWLYVLCILLIIFMHIGLPILIYFLVWYNPSVPSYRHYSQQNYLHSLPIDINSTNV